MAREAIDAVIELQSLVRSKGKELQSLEVSKDMYNQLEIECAPQSPSEYFEMPILILKGEPKVH